MLGVLKRRWKPKRPTTEKENNTQNKKNLTPKTEPVPVDIARINTSPRQIHPLFEDKAQLLAYEENINSQKSTPTPNPTKRSPIDPLPNPLLQVPKKSPVENHTHSIPPRFHPPPPPYPPAPNICVEGGRIEFVKSPSEGSNLYANTVRHEYNGIERRVKQTRSVPLTFVSTATLGSLQSPTGTRAPLGENGKQTPEEKCDLAKEYLEARIKELERLLDAEQKAGQRERLAVARLQRQLARRETIQRDAERERRLRLDTESRLREATGETERCRANLVNLQREFSRMEDTVRTMLQYKTRCELLNQEKASLTVVYENRAHQYQNTITKLGQENETLKKQLQLLEVSHSGDAQTSLLDRIRHLESENTNLSRESEFQRRQYERCLDDIANQVVRALLSQKGLREEIGNLQRRIKELENQNQALANILVHKLQHGDTMALPSLESKINSETFDNCYFPGMYSPSSVGGRSHCPATPESPLTSVSTSSEVKRRLTRHHFSDVGDRNLLEALHSLEPLMWLPLQRPKSLNIHIQESQVQADTGSRKCTHRKNRSSLVANKKPSEDEGNESPESGNRDEGYSTMSSDVQGPGEANELSKRGLEDLKEATDESDIVVVDTKSTIIVEDASDPDILFIPINFSIGIQSRNSYPPSKDYSPLQTVIRSFSDSHLCLKLTTPLPLCRTPVTPVLVVDVCDKKGHPLRRSKATTSLLRGETYIQETEDTQSSNGSWGSGVVDGCWWDTEYVQHWLRLDDNRLKQQQSHDMLELEYDRTELEDWSMSLSCEDITKSEAESFSSRKVGDALTPGTLPSIRETEGVELEEDCVWNDLTIETRSFPPERAQSAASPGGSWSSVGTGSDCCHSLNGCCFNDCSGVESKRSSGASDEVECLPVGTDFTRDFYRLVKYESTKSLTSISSKSVNNGEFGSLTRRNCEDLGQDHDRELALQSVLNFIAEQQQYCHSREEEDLSETFTRPVSQEMSEDPRPKDCVSEREDNNDDCDENALKLMNENFQIKVEVKGSSQLSACNSDNLVADTEHLPVTNRCNETDKLQRTENFSKCLEDDSRGQKSINGLITLKEEEEESEGLKEMSESFTSSISTPDTIVPPKVKYDSPVRNRETSIPIYNAKKLDTKKENKLVTRETKKPTPKPRKKETKIPVKSAKPSISTKSKDMRRLETNIPILKRRDLSIPLATRADVLPGCPSSKDMIDELNRMIRKGDEVTPGCSEGEVRPLDMACCCPTGWVHVERDIDFTDPKARANLLDVMLASSGSSGSDSTSDSGGDEPVDYNHLHRIHRFRRQKKASATREQLGVLRYPISSIRPSIIGRDDFFVRYGEKEREAVASFDFLEDFSTTSVSGCSSSDTLGSSQQRIDHTCHHLHPDIDLPSPVKTPVTPTTPNDDSDGQVIGGAVSFSDSCADSFSASSEEHT